MTTGPTDHGNRGRASVLRVAITLLCLLPLAAACSGPSGAPAASKADFKSSGSAVDVCSLVKKADVAVAYGGDVGAAVPGSGTCTFEVGGTAKAGSPMVGGDVPRVIVSLTPGEWNSTADQQKLFPGDQVTPVKGVGEEAWSSGFVLNVKHGSDRLSVSNEDFVAYDADELAADRIALAKIIFSRL